MAEQTGWEIGICTIAISLAVLLLWFPLRERPGLGTVANAVLIGFVIDAVLAAIDPQAGLALRYACVVGGIALVGLGSGLYINAALGRGPRDGLIDGAAPSHRVADLRHPSPRSRSPCSSSASCWAAARDRDGGVRAADRPGGAPGAATASGLARPGALHSP